MRVWVALAGVLAVVGGGFVAAASLAWPGVRLDASDQALAAVMLPDFAGRVVAVEIRSADGERVPARIRQGRLWPLAKLAAGERLTVELTLRRPRWAGWLIGRTQRRRFTIETPSVHLRSRWLRVRAGAPVRIAFDAPVRLVSLGRGRCGG